MSAQLLVRSLHCSYGPDVVIADATFTVAPDDRLGVIGPNGSGKSTLLAALAGLHEPASGSVRATPAGAVVTLMDQRISEHDRSMGLEAWLRARTGVDAVEAELEAASTDLDAPDGHERYDRALARFVAIDPAGFDERMRAMLVDVGLGGVDATHLVGELSGGQRTRAQLASIGLVSADVLLLDEPTNDLDTEGLALLGELLADRRGSTVVVSHDRAFLSSFVTGVLEIDGHDHSVTRYDGGFDAWQAERARARRQAEEAHRQWADTRDELKARARRQREWSARGVASAKRANEPDRNVRQLQIESSEKKAANASKTERALERHERNRVDKPWEGWELRLELAEVARAGSVVARLDAAVVHRGDFVFGPVDALLGAGDRVLLTGANGAGKTTLIELLFGDLQPSLGQAHVGPGSIVGRMAQGRSDLGDGPLLDAFIAASSLEHAEARSALAKFGLGADHIDRPTTALSPGELTRGVLAVFSARGVNTLVLDEPTNHLDLEAVEQLESALGNFRGTLLLVTHDQRMIEAIEITRRWHIEEGRLVDG